MKSILDTICPCHMIVNEHGEIEHFGPGLRELLNQERYLYENLFSVFNLTRPAGLKTIKNVIEYAGRTITMHLRKAPDVKLRAVAVRDPASNDIVLNVSFGIGVQTAIRKFGLTMKDFAPTDLVPELLYLIEANHAAMTASKRLTLRLQGAKALAEEQAFTDTLTGLKNRRAFEVMLKHMRDTQDPFSIVMMDLDRFKAVNDTYGHAAGDAVLMAVADVMRRETRQNDILVRLGGDEFVMILPHLVDRVRLERLCGLVIAGTEEPVTVDQFRCEISSSLGVISVYAGQKWDDADIIDRVDAAVYAAKKAGRGCYRFADENVTADAINSKR